MNRMPCTKVTPLRPHTCPFVIDEVHCNHILVLLLQGLEVLVEGGGGISRSCDDGGGLVLDARELGPQQRDGASHLCMPRGWTQCCKPYTAHFDALTADGDSIHDRDIEGSSALSCVCSEPAHYPKLISGALGV